MWRQKAKDYKTLGGDRTRDGRYSNEQGFPDLKM
jgi:hypothetical protein